MRPVWHYSAWLLCTSTIVLFAAPDAAAFIINPNFDPWLTTASGPRSGNGDPGTLTWSIVPDGTQTPDGAFGSLEPSNLIASFDNTFGAGPSATDLKQKPWFIFFKQAFSRWSQLGGLKYTYEPNDDGVPHGSAAGQLGVRGDVRIAGVSIDGPSDTLAFNFLPDDGDMTLDTDDMTFFSNSTNEQRALRNTIMHEAGHGFGLQHVATNANLLMEPTIMVSFDGAQLDEVRGVQYYFGDANEKGHGGQGNDTAARATSLGTLPAGGARRVGADADVPGQSISSSATDFVSIANLSDTDFYSFTVSQPTSLDAVLTPRGGLFTQGSEGTTPTSFDASARSDLVLAILDTNGTSTLAFADNAAAGGSEAVQDVSLNSAGQYFVRVTGRDDTIQFYELAISLAGATLLFGDANNDGLVTGLDLIFVQENFGRIEPGGPTGFFLGDADDNGRVTGADLLVVQQRFGSMLSPEIGTSVPAPEPVSIALMALAWVCFVRRRRIEPPPLWPLTVDAHGAGSPRGQSDF